MKRLFCLLLLAAVPVFAQDDYSEIVDRAFEAIDQGLRTNWAYTESRLEEGTLWVGRYDPRREEEGRWQLLSVDGREPTAEEIEEYRDEQDGPDESDKNSRTTRVDRNSLTLREEGDDYLLFDFDPAEDDDEFMENVDAMLKIVTASEPYVASMDMSSRKAFKPAAGIKIHEFATHLTFAPQNENGPVLPRSVRVKVRGRAYLVISFDESTSIDYSDYEYVGDGVD